MDRNAPDERAVEIACEVRRECDDAVEGVELLEHDGAGDVDGLVCGLRDGRHPLAEDAVRFVEEEERVLLLGGLERGHDVLAGFADVFAFDFRVAHVDEFLAPFAGKRLDAHRLARAGRPVEVEGDVASARVGFAKAPVLVDEAVRPEPVFEGLETFCGGGVEHEVRERIERFARDERDGRLLLLFPVLIGRRLRCGWRLDGFRRVERGFRIDEVPVSVHSRSAFPAS